MRISPMNEDRTVKHRFQFESFVLSLFVTLLCAADVPAADEDEALQQKARESFASLTPHAEKAREAANSTQVELGRKLFFEPRLSADGVWSCMLCHQPGLYATDAQRLSRGVFDRFLPRNAPTVLNASLQFKSHWDGRFENVEEQAAHSLTGPGFGNKSIEEGMERIQSIPGYAALFATAFPEDDQPINDRNFATAIGAYERTLITPGRFDEFLDGKKDALSPEEKQGLNLFIEVGCVNCHSGVNLGGEAFEKFGEYGDYWSFTKSEKIDTGRFDVTQDKKDLYVFKVSPLRNVAMTPPYFHDGSVDELSDAVKIMAKVQLDRELTDDQISSLVQFLKSLTGTLPANYAQAPVLPSGTFHSTPQPKVK